MSSSRFWRVRGRLSGECRPKDDPLGLRTEEGRCGGLAARRGRGEGVIKFQLDGWGLLLSMGSATSISVPQEGRVLTRTMRWALRGRRLRVGVTARALFTFHYLVIWQQLLTLWERDASFNVYTATVGKD